MTEQQEGIDLAAACQGKEPLASRHMAQKILARRREAKTKKGRYSIYQCGYCGKWHIGQTAEKRARGR